MQTSGVLYIATGAPYLEEARRSARSVKMLHPDLQICVVTDQVVPPDNDFDIVLDAEHENADTEERFLARDRVAYYRKILPLSRSPFEKTIFLDSDTWVAAPIDELFTLLDRFDLLTTPAHVVHDYAFEREEPPFANIPAAFGYFNTGLVAYRKGTAVDRFMRQWVANYERHTARFTVNDQPAFRLTLFEEDLKFHVLPTNYNIISWVPFIVPAGGRVVMLHGRNPWHQRWVEHFRGGAVPTIVGVISWSALFRYHAARVLYLLRRILKRK